MSVHGRKAAIAIDLGTNTFHILIGRFLPSGKIHVLYKRRFYVRLGREGMHTISADAIRDARAACLHFRELLDLWPGLPVRVMGTAGFRQSSNGPSLQNELEAILHMPIEVLSGKEEAKLIASGVRARVKDAIPHYLVLGIGGGSSEFAFVRDGQLTYYDSFLAGVALLKSKFQKHDPILPQEMADMHDYFRQEFKPVLNAVKGEEQILLIGAAGIFDVLAGIVRKHKRGTARMRQLDLTKLRSFMEWVCQSDSRTRLADIRIPSERVDLIPAAMILIRWVVDELPVRDFLVSSFSLKEGALYEMLHD